MVRSRRFVNMALKHLLDANLFKEMKEKSKFVQIKAQSKKKIIEIPFKNNHI